MTYLEEMIEAMADLRYEECLHLVRASLTCGLPARKILREGLIPGLKKVGEKFENNEYFLSEMLFSVHIMRECMNFLEPLLAKDTKKLPSIGKAAVGTVKGDIHDIGKNIFVILMTMSGFDVIDLGIDVSSKKFVDTVKERKPDILGMSALLTTTAGYFKTVINALKEAGLRDKLYIMIGGPPNVTAKEVGADIYCNDAFLGVRKALEYIERKK